VDNNLHHRIIRGVQALEDMGDPDSLKILNLIDRLLADDWTGSGVYEALDGALKAAEGDGAIPQRNTQFDCEICGKPGGH